MDAIPESVSQFSGPRSGPRVVALGGVHGNEITGVMLVERLRADLERGALALAAGTLTLVVGNPRAVELGTRGSEPHADLNRSFTTETLDSNGPDGYEARRARELAPIIAASDLVIDLHATNKPSDPFAIAFVDTLEHRELCALFPCDKLLLVPTEVIGGTTAGYAPGRGERSFEPFVEGDLIGAYGDTELRAAYDGTLMFPKVPELWKVGSPVAFLARLQA